jgi:hypothetical protein
VLHTLDQLPEVKARAALGEAVCARVGGLGCVASYLYGRYLLYVTTAIGKKNPSIPSTNQF